MRRQRVDVIYISGGRSLYLRRGARPVGTHARHIIDRKTAARLRDSSLTIKPAGLRQASVLARLYDASSVRHVRSVADWRGFLTSGICGNFGARPFIAYAGRRPVAYVVHKHATPSQSPASRAAEWAGAPESILAVLGALPILAGRKDVEITVDALADAPLAQSLRNARVPGVAVPTGRTVIVLRPAALFRKLGPYLPPAARELRVTDQRRGARFTLGRQTLDVPPPMVARVFFGSPEEDVDALLGRAGTLGELIRMAFPVPLPGYGYNYI